MSAAVRLLPLLALMLAFGCAAVPRPAEPSGEEEDFHRPPDPAERALLARATLGRTEAAWRPEAMLPDAPKGRLAFLCRDARGRLWRVTVRLPAAVAEPPAFVGAQPLEPTPKGTVL